MRRLHRGLLAAGVESKILSVREAETDESIIVSKSSKLESGWNERTKKITEKYGLDDVLNVNSMRLRKHPVFREADVVNFHRIPGVISYLGLPTLTKDKPAVYTLCDMWALTGHCRYSFSCERWQIGCGHCPQMDRPPSIERDATHLHWRLKRWAYRRSQLTLVAKSHWLERLSKESFLNRFPIYHIPNGIDTDLYKPYDPDVFRTEHGIAPHEKLIMFGAQRLDKYVKGWDLLQKALTGLPAALKKDLVLILFGRNGNIVSESVDFRTIDMGFISEDEAKARVYAAADLFLLPSRAEVFPNVALESIACGTPVVAFNGSGTEDPVRHGITGYLASPEDPDDFQRGIVSLLQDEAARLAMASNGRAIAVEEYQYDHQVEKYIDLYQQLKQ